MARIEPGCEICSHYDSVLKFCNKSASYNYAKEWRMSSCSPGWFDEQKDEEENDEQTD